MIKKKIYSFSVHEGMFEKMKTESYLIKYTKKIIIYQTYTQYTVVGRVHITEMITY